MIIAGLDTETTGKLSPEHRVIELCVQQWEYEPGYVPTLKDNRTWRIHPDRSIEPGAYKVHGISLDDLAGKPTFDKVAPEILDHMSKVDLFVAHNGDDFDKPMLTMELERFGLALPSRPWLDTMQSGRWATALGKVPNLKELCWASDVEYDPSKAHAADYDVTVMMKCFFFGLKCGRFTLPGL